MVICFKSINWGEPQASNSECFYDHLIGSTPLGRFLITWKGWKEYANYTVDESPWGEELGVWAPDLEGMKAECERVWQERLQACLLTEEVS